MYSSIYAFLYELYWHCFAIASSQQMDVLRLSAEQHEWLQVLCSDSTVDDSNLEGFVEDVIGAILNSKLPLKILGKFRCAIVVVMFFSVRALRSVMYG